MPQTIATQMAAPNRAAHVFNPFLNDVMLFASDSLNSKSRVDFVASIARPLDSGIARARLDAADDAARGVLDYIFGHSHPQLIYATIVRDASSLVNTV